MEAFKPELIRIIPSTSASVSLVPATILLFE